MKTFDTSKQQSDLSNLISQMRIHLLSKDCFLFSNNLIFTHVKIQCLKCIVFVDEICQIWCVILIYQSHLIDQTSVFVMLFVEKQKQ